MPWLYLLLALAALAVAFKTTSVALLVVCLLVAFALTLAWVMTLLAQRVDNSSRSEAMMLDPAELHRLRELADARKRAASSSSASQGEPQR